MYKNIFKIRVLIIIIICKKEEYKLYGWFFKYRVCMVLYGRNSIVFIFILIYFMLFRKIDIF